MSTLQSSLLGYLINSIWQVPLLFAAAWLITRALRSPNPAIEHRIWVGALLFEALLPACPAAPARWLGQLTFWPRHAAPAGAEHISVGMGDGIARGMLHLPPSLLTTVTLLYVAALACLIARFLWHGWKLSALRRRSTPLRLSGEAAACWQQNSQHFGIHDATLATSAEIFGPLTLGLRRNLVLLPSSMAGSLATEDLHTVVAHEFAHIRRHDFLKNLLYECITLPARYHPLLWLTRDRVIESREMVCDRLAAHAEGKKRYVRSLLRLASLLVSGAPVRTPHAIGIFDSNTFERRLMKLTESRKELRGIRGVLTLAACLTLALATCCSALALHVAVSSDSAHNSSNPATIHVPGGVMAGQVLTRVNPVYPPSARKAKIQGTVVLHAVVGKDGTIDNIQVISGPEELRHSAVDAVRQWTYKPYLLNGDPVQIETTIQVTYALQP